MDIRRAERNDAPGLVTIINQAFRVERFFIENDRIDLDQVLELLGKGEFPSWTRPAASTANPLAIAAISGCFRYVPVCKAPALAEGS